MAALGFDHADEVTVAVRAIVSDPAHGRDSLDESQATTNLLQELLPDAPRETGLLIGVAGVGLPARLRRSGQRQR